MKKIAYFLSLAVIAIALTAIARRTAEPSIASPNIIGSWKAVKTQYGDQPMKTRGENDFTVVKIFTATRWSGAFFNPKTKEFDGACGGTYELNGDEYLETIEYYSWDAASVGTKGKFTLKMENGMLHQFGKFEYKGNKEYVVDEWYKKID